MRDSWVVYSKTELPVSLSIVRIRRVRFTRVTQRHADIRRNKDPSLGKTQVKILHQRSPYGMKFEDRSQEEIERQERCASGKAWNLARHIYKLTEKDEATFYSPTEEWIMPAASTKKPEEREFVVDSGASMHMVSKRDLDSFELETMRISKNPTTVMMANGEVQTREEATVYVKGLDLFVTVMLLEDTPAVLLLGKNLRRSRIFLPLDHWSETTTHQRRQTNKMAHGKLRTDRCPWSIDRLFKLSYTYIYDISIAGSRNSHTASRIDKRREYEWHRKSTARPVAWTTRNQKSNEK